MQEKIQKLRELGSLIEARRKTLGLSKTVLCSKFAHLGSSKTYAKILNPDFPLETGMDLDGQLESYAAAWELFQSFNSDAESLRIYGDIGQVKFVCDTVIEAQGMPDNTRFIMITGRSGAGKSTILDYLGENPRTAKAFYRIEASEVWRENVNDLLGAILTAVRIVRSSGDEEEEESAPANPERNLPQGRTPRLDKLIEILGPRRLILAIDEGHHIGPAGFNVLKTLINSTRVVIVLTAIPELVLRISRRAYAECDQLFSNRLLNNIKLAGPAAKDVITFLKRRGVVFASVKDEADICAKLAADALGCGHWKYIVRFVRKAKAPNLPPVDSEMAAKFITQIKGAISLGG